MRKVRTVHKVESLPVPCVDVGAFLADVERLNRLRSVFEGQLFTQEVAQPKEPLPEPIEHVIALVAEFERAVPLMIPL